MRSAIGSALATVFGAGLAPLAPGTAGSLVAAAVFFFTVKGLITGIIACCCILAISYWGCLEGRRLWGKDPSRVVIDEFAGCWIACLGAPLHWGIAGVAAAFVLFRILDIFKPWPVSVFDEMDSAAGILLDDVAAGAIAALALFLISLSHVLG